MLKLARPAVAVLAAGALTAIVSARTVAPPSIVARQWHVVEIPLVAGSSSGNGTAINNLGHVVGAAGFPNFSNHVFLWDGVNPPVDLGIPSPGASSARPYAINDNDWIAGNSFIGQVSRGFVWDGHAMHVIDPVNTSFPTATSVLSDINASGTAVGYRTGSCGDNTCSRAIAWTPQGISNLPLLGDATFAFRINNSGAILGHRNDFAATSVSAPVIWHGGQASLLPNPPLQFQDFGLNASEQVVGRSIGENVQEPYLWTGSSWKLLPVPAPASSAAVAADINSSGHMVGVKFSQGLPAQILFWESATSVLDLNASLDAASQGWTITDVGRLNDSDQIAAMATKTGVGTRAVRLDPVFQVDLFDPRPLVVPWAPSNLGPAFSKEFAAGCCASVDGLTADGLSHVLIRIQTSAPVHLEVSGSNNGGLKRLGPNDTPLVSTAGTSSVDLTSDRGYAYALYKAPNDLGDNAHPSRLITVSVTGPGIAGSIQIDLHRPPILAIHGFWSNGTSWDDFRSLMSQSAAFQTTEVVAPDLPMTDVRLDLASMVDPIRKRLDALRREYLDNRRIVAGRVDVVTKSTGGPVARLWMLHSRYSRNENFYSGDFHRVITVAAIHGGSFLADLLIDWQEGKLSAPAPSQSVLDLFRSADRTIDGTLLDLGSHSSVLCGMPAIDGHFHSIAGDPSSGGVAGIPFFEFLALFGVPSLFPPEPHDGVTTVTSALGALTGFHTDLLSYWHEEHLAPTGAVIIEHTPALAARVEMLLSTSASDALTFASVFPSFPCSSQQAGIANGAAWSGQSPESPPLGTADATNITLSGVPASAALGSTLSITASSDVADPISGALFLWDGGSSFDGSSPFTATVLLSQPGRVSVRVLAVTSSGAVGMAQNAVNVSPAGTLTGLSFSPAAFVVSSAPAQQKFQLTAIYSGGATFTIADSGFGVVLASTNPSVATMGTDFTVSAFTTGTATISATMSGVTAYLPVIVKTPPANPDPAALVQNGNFLAGLTNWSLFATPTASYLVTSVENGVLHFYRQPPPPGEQNQAVVLQPTGVNVPAGVPLVAQFDLGNTSAARKRISVLIHDLDFQDLSVCTFWLLPNTPLQTYQMRTHTTKNWSNATISFYAATVGSDGGFYQLTNVSLGPATSSSADATDCVDPTAPLPNPTPSTANLIVNGSFSAGLDNWSPFFDIAPQVANGVVEFIRPGTPGSSAGGLLQSTGQALPAGRILTSTFELGNSSTVRKRVTVLIHDYDFTDLSACTFWLAPGQPLSPYSMRMFTTKAWTNATFSLYAATIGPEQWTRLDNVTLASTPSATLNGTECHEFALSDPGGSAVLGSTTLRQVLPEAFQSVQQGLTPTTQSVSGNPSADSATSMRAPVVGALWIWTGDWDRKILVEISFDGFSWHQVPFQVVGDWVTFDVDQLRVGYERNIWVRVKPTG